MNYNETGADKIVILVDYTGVGMVGSNLHTIYCSFNHWLTNLSRSRRN
jgi:hypothetical protein